MSERTNLPLVEWDSEPIKPPGQPGWFQMEKGGPLIRCNCGEIMHLNPAHVIEQNGDVNASFLHPGCGWHVWLHLEGWAA